MPPYDMIVIFGRHTMRIFSPHLSQESIEQCEHDWCNNPTTEDQGYGFWEVAVARGKGIRQEIIGSMAVSRSAPLKVAC